MANSFRGTGNLGTDPELKHVSVDGETRQVAEMRIYFDRSVPDGEGSFVDRGGFWLTTSIWGPRAEHITRVLRTGARVAVEGHLEEHNWEKDGEPRSRHQLTASNLTLDLSRVESVTFQAKTSAASAGANAAAGVTTEPAEDEASS